MSMLSPATTSAFGAGYGGAIGGYGGYGTSMMGGSARSASEAE